MARVIEGVEAYEHIIGLGARLDVPDILNPLRSIPRSGFVHTRPVREFRSVGFVIELQKVGQYTAHIGIPTVVRPNRRVVIVVEDGASGPRPLTGLVAFVGQQHLPVGRRRSCRSIVFEGLGVRVALTGTAGIEQGVVIGGSPGQHGLVGLDGILPTVVRL